jgi:PEGA domain
MRVGIALLVTTCLLAFAPAARAQATPAAAAEATDGARKEQARTHFERGAALVRAQSWEAALAEFLLSRELYPTRGNTQNAAVCLRQLERYDEALDMLELLLATFPTIAAADRTAAEEDIRQLRLLVGALDVRVSEPDAQIQIDQRGRGSSPLAKPVRVKAGSHGILVYKPGFVTSVTRVDVAGSRTVVVDVRLEALRESGHLRVLEQGGRSAEVVVDGFPVGSAPWEGSVASGSHTVTLRGEEGTGTQPAQVTVATSGVTPLTLALEALDAELRVEPTPSGARVAVDGVPVGSGVWSGRVRSGGHKVEAAAEGFLPRARSLLLASGQRQTVEMALDRDPESSMWGGSGRAHFVLDGSVGLATGSLFGGDVSGGCVTGCSTALPIGTQGMVHAGYELKSRVSVALDAGYLVTGQKTRGRSVSATPRGRAPIDGTADDALALRGLTLGGSVAYHTASALPFTLRLGAGVLLGEARDERTAQFPLGPTGATETAAARYGYVSPELRVGLPLGEHTEVLLGVQALVLVAITKPSWQDADNVVLGRDFLSFGEAAMVGPVLLVVTPGVGLRYEL